MIVVITFGSEFVRAPVNKVIVSCVPEAQQGSALGTSKTIQKLASTISLAVVVGIFSSSYATALHDDLTSQNLDGQIHAVEPQSLSAILQAEQLLSGDDSPDLAVFEEAVSDAFATAQRLAMGLGALTSLLAAFVAWRYLRPEKSDPSQTIQTSSPGPPK